MSSKTQVALTLTSSMRQADRSALAENPPGPGWEGGPALAGAAVARVARLLTENSPRTFRWVVDPDTVEVKNITVRTSVLLRLAATRPLPWPPATEQPGV